MVGRTICQKYEICKMLLNANYYKIFSVKDTKDSSQVFTLKLSLDAAFIQNQIKIMERIQDVLPKYA